MKVDGIENGIGIVMEGYVLVVFGYWVGMGRSRLDRHEILIWDTEWTFACSVAFILYDIGIIGCLINKEF